MLETASHMKSHVVIELHVLAYVKRAIVNICNYFAQKEMCSTGQGPLKKHQKLPVSDHSLFCALWTAF